jgi:hypothetical protein
MPKDATRNIDSNQLRSSQLNSFEFHQNQGAVSEQQKEQGNWMGAPDGETNLPPDKAKAERIRRLLAKHGQSVPKTEERQPEEYEMEEQRAEEQHNESQTQMASEPSVVKEEDQWNEARASEKDFAPTHGRSPEVIKEMIQSRRATDKVPDPEDLIAGRTAESQEKKEYGKTVRRTATRLADKQTASTKPAQNTTGKKAALDRNKPGIAKGTSEKKAVKQAAPGKSTKQAITTKSRKKAAASTTTKRAAASSAEKQATPRKSAVSTSSNRSNATKPASPRPKANGKAATRTAKPARTAASTRSKSPAGKGR